MCCVDWDYLCLLSRADLSQGGRYILFCAQTLFIIMMTKVTLSAVVVDTLPSTHSVVVVVRNGRWTWLRGNGILKLNQEGFNSLNELCEMETPVFPAAQDATEERGPECWYIGQQPPLCTSSASHGGTCVGPAHNVSLYCTDSQFPVHCSKFISSCSPPLFEYTQRNHSQESCSGYGRE